MTFWAVQVGPRRIRLGGCELPVRLNAATGAVVVAGSGAASGGHRIRQWSFAERRNLLIVHADPRGDLDVVGLVAAAASLLVTPEPAGHDVELLGLAALAWCAGGGAPEPAPSPDVDPATQLLALARHTGWAAADIDSALAAEVDRWYAAASGRQARATVADDGFRTFLLNDDAATRGPEWTGAPELAEAFDEIAAWITEVATPLVVVPPVATRSRAGRSAAGPDGATAGEDAHDDVDAGTLAARATGSALAAAAATAGDDTGDGRAPAAGTASSVVARGSGRGAKTEDAVGAAASDRPPTDAPGPIADPIATGPAGGARRAADAPAERTADQPSTGPGGVVPADAGSGIVASAERPRTKREDGGRRAAAPLAGSARSRPRGLAARLTARPSGATSVPAASIAAALAPMLGEAAAPDDAALATGEGLGGAGAPDSEQWSGAGRGPASAGGLAAQPPARHVAAGQDWPPSRARDIDPFFADAGDDDPSGAGGDVAALADRLAAHLETSTLELGVLRAGP